MHDEIVLEVDAADAERASAWLTDCMVRGMAEFVKDVPIVVEPAIMRDWSGTRLSWSAGMSTTAKLFVDPRRRGTRDQALPDRLQMVGHDALVRPGPIDFPEPHGSASRSRSTKTSAAAATWLASGGSMATRR